jgi:hypothetical protein
MNWFKRLFSRKKKSIEDMKPLINLIEDKSKPLRNSTPKYQFKEEYQIKGQNFKLGDKVIGRSNECDPLLIGEIVEFWDNDGKWSTCIPYVKDENGDVWGNMGHLVHYSDELYEKIKDLKPLEQWNYFLPEDSPYKYTEEVMERKQKAYEARKNIG